MSSARPLARCQWPDANRRHTARETVARWSPSVVRRCRYAMSVPGPSRLSGRLIEIAAIDGKRTTLQHRGSLGACEIARHERDGGEDI